ncbi:hypothetical protein K443DRAFT_580836 [Laccaria amethystina LaAM-08-1]|uniref:Uncharacterized protein n=1 Tax=Laccaria amethystina LaAM-08-1 TaxID=1095629 RepID=A0A0C9X0D6_9AGAR|nr:hypothetical protein K443DRAFT_580836 [Laccaria amethystina LaAM-08-1]
MHRSRTRLRAHPCLLNVCAMRTRLNQAMQGSGNGEVRVLAFHHSPAVPVLCVASADCRVRLFNVDAHLNPLVTTFHLPSLPLTSPTSALFHPRGTYILLSGPRPFFYTYDLQTGTSAHHARDLWGNHVGEHLR